MFVFHDIFRTEYTPLCPGGDGMLKNFIRSRLHFLSNEEMHLVVLTKDNTTYQKKNPKKLVLNQAFTGLDMNLFLVIMKKESSK